MAGHPDRWIVVSNWTRFQHYKDRDPLWIKTYTRLLRDDDYLELSGHLRALLHGLWLMAAENHGCVRHDTAMISRRLALRVTTPHIESLNHAGFVEVLASKPLAPETETETETETTRALLLESLGATPNPVRPRSDSDRPSSAYGFEGALLNLLRQLHDRDDGTEGVIRNLVRKHGLGEGAIRSAIDVSRGARLPAAAAVRELKRQAQLKNGGPT